MKGRAYEDGLIAVSDDITAEEAAPLLCVGETMFSALHNSRLIIFREAGIMRKVESVCP